MRPAASCAAAAESAYPNAKDMPSNINWSSPEVLHESAVVDQSADIWSLALVIAEILTGDVPFDSPDLRMMDLKAFREKLRLGLRPPIPGFVSERESLSWLHDLLDRAWAFEPADRCSSLEMIAAFESYLGRLNERESTGSSGGGKKQL